MSMSGIVVFAYCLVILLFIILATVRILYNCEAFDDSKQSVIQDENLPEYDENPPDYTIVYIDPPTYPDPVLVT